VIVLHGWGGNAAMMLPLARPLHEAGFAALFIDARCHGTSDDDGFASLPRFAEDLEHAFEWLAARAEGDAGRIGLIGHSVGAGAALLAASRRADVAAVVSVAAFSHPAAMMRRWLATKRIPERPVGRYILDYVQRTIGHRFDDIAPVNTIARVRCPVLVVHGADDDVVPLDDAYRIFAARTHEAVKLLVLGGDHDSFANLGQHMEQLIDFLRAAMAPRSDGDPPLQTPSNPLPHLAMERMHDLGAPTTGEQIPGELHLQKSGGPKAPRRALAAGQSYGPEYVYPQELLKVSVPVWPPSVKLMAPPIAPVVQTSASIFTLLTTTA